MQPNNPIWDEERDLLTIQREVSLALRLSFEAVVHEPVPEQMTILLLRLALAESLRASVRNEPANSDDLACECSDLSWSHLAIAGSR